MVGIFSRFSGYNMDKKEGQVGERDGAGEVDLHGHMGRAEGDDDDLVEFKPIEHPIEPPEDDWPVKCPMMPDFSLINDEIIWKEPFPENPQKRAESLVAYEAEPKRHHTIAQDPAILLPSKGPQYNIFEVFQQCKEFGFS